MNSGLWNYNHGQRRDRSYQEAGRHEGDWHANMLKTEKKNWLDLAQDANLMASYWVNCKCLIVSRTQQDHSEYNGAQCVLNLEFLIVGWISTCPYICTRTTTYYQPTVRSVAKDNAHAYLYCRSRIMPGESNKSLRTTKKEYVSCLHWTTNVRGSLQCF